MKQRFQIDQHGVFPCRNQVLEMDVTITAPETFSVPWMRSFTWELDPDGIIYESVCDPADSRF